MMQDGMNSNFNAVVELIESQNAASYDESQIKEDLHEEAMSPENLQE